MQKELTIIDHQGSETDEREELQDWQRQPVIGNLMWEYGLTHQDIEATGGCLDEAIRLKKLGHSCFA